MATIQFRRGTAASIQAANPILHVGEPILELDTKKIKIGDGSTLYNSLPYFISSFGPWVNFIPTVDGIPHVNWYVASYRSVGGLKDVQFVLKGVLTGAVDTIIRVQPPPGITFDMTKFSVGGTAYCYRGGVGYYSGALMDDTTGKLMPISMMYWTPAFPLVFQTNDWFGVNVIISIV